MDWAKKHEVDMDQSMGQEIAKSPKKKGQIKKIAKEQG